MQTLANLTQEAAKESPLLIVWPEAATPGPISLDRKLYQRVRKIANQAGSYLLLGSTHQAKMEKDRGGLV